MLVRLGSTTAGRRGLAMAAAAESAAVSAVSGAVGAALLRVQERVAAAGRRSGRPEGSTALVAVGKTKPVALLREAYDAGQRVFGENYAQELVEKAPQLPGDVQWHFIGHLQSNKAKALLEKVPNLVCVETVDTPKLASRLDRLAEGRPSPLQIMIQVNTSGEASKHGVEPAECVGMAKHIREECPNLVLGGLMTIGMPDYTSRPENFTTLSRCREEVAQALQVDEESLGLSMGMSGDFENAIGMGSTSVRVGSTIFGAREYPNKK